LFFVLNVKLIMV